MSQEPTLFQTTIYDNIAMGRPGATEDEIHEAAQRANAHKFISIMPAGYSTQVGLCYHTLDTTRLFKGQPFKQHAASAWQGHC